MADNKVPLCPRCKLRWKRSIMVEERGSWTLSRLLRCTSCGLVDYPGEAGTRRYGPVIYQKVTDHDSKLSEAAEKRREMLADLQRIVRLCNCKWPIVKYRNGDGHDDRCPAHTPLGSRSR